jgi:hypothetical protein
MSVKARNSSVQKSFVPRVALYGRVRSSLFISRSVSYQTLSDRGIVMSKRASDGAGLLLTTNEREQPPVSSSPTEPISAQQPPSPPSTQGSVQSLPFHVAIADGGLEIEARIRKEKDLDNLIRVLQTIKPLLPNIYGQQPSAVADPPDPPDVGEHRQHAFDDSMTPQKQAENRDVVLYYKNSERRTATVRL